MPEPTFFIGWPPIPPIDPVYHPPARTLAVRTLPTTNAVLQRLAKAEGREFWGEAIGLILDFTAHFVELVDLSNLTYAPHALTSMGGAIHHQGGLVSRGVQTPLSEPAFDLVRTFARKYKITPQKAATLILYRCIGTVPDLITAYRQVIQ